MWGRRFWYKCSFLEGYPPEYWIGCQRTYVSVVQVGYGMYVLDWYQDGCWKLEPTMVSGLSGVIQWF